MTTRTGHRIVSDQKQAGQLSSCAERGCKPAWANCAISPQQNMARKLLRHRHKHGAHSIHTSPQALPAAPSAQQKSATRAAPRARRGCGRTPRLQSPYAHTQHGLHTGRFGPPSCAAHTGEVALARAASGPEQGDNMAHPLQTQCGHGLQLRLKSEPHFEAHAQRQWMTWSTHGVFDLCIRISGAGTGFTVRMIS